MSGWYRTIRPFVPLWSRLFVWMYPRGLYLLAGGSYLLLETTGRRTGLRRVTALGYVRWGNSFLLQPLHGENSAWLLNLRHQPEVGLKVRRRRLIGRARTIKDYSERLMALRAIAASRTVGGLTARRHFGLLRHPDEESLQQAANGNQPIIEVEI